MWKPLEENEDDRETIISQLQARSFSKADVFVGVSASGLTPYVLSGLSYAKSLAPSLFQSAATKRRKRPSSATLPSKPRQGRK
ncbi:hypothetical protein QKW52_09200 [Bacillus sonorensis]|nr:hypothetical protein [Bacillus sonorensis]